MTDLSRRAFLQLTGGAGAALTAARKRLYRRLVSPPVPQEHFPPGQWAFYSTVCRECPAGCGIMVWHRDGRITKAEGNPDHPLNQGRLCPRGQSAPQGLYDPDRIRGPLHRGMLGEHKPASWNKALSAIAERLWQKGSRVRLLSDLQTGSLAEVMQAFTGALGSDRPLFYEAFNYDPLRRAHDKAFGLPVIPRYQLEEADFIVSFGVDFLESWVSPVEYALEFAETRTSRNGRVGRFDYVGPRLSMTAANADDLMLVSPGRESFIALAMLQELVAQGAVVENIRPAAAQIQGITLPLADSERQMARILAQRFAKADRPVALGGALAARGAMPQFAALCAALLNQARGQGARVVDYNQPHALSHTATDEETEAFLKSLGPQDVLIVHHANPAFTLPSSSDALQRAGMLVYLGSMLDETASLAHWVLPTDYYLESWGDYDPYPGVHGLIQPAMARLFDTRSAGDVLLDLIRRSGRQPAIPGTAGPVEDFAGWVRMRWAELNARLASNLSPEAFWEQARRQGGFWQEQPAAAAPELRQFTLPILPAAEISSQQETAQLWCWPNINLFDGRLANRTWMQETPEPISFIAWSSWVDLHPHKAHALGLRHNDLVELATTAGRIQVPVRITNEVASDCAALVLGQGHKALGKTAQGIGANAFALMGASQPGYPFAQVNIHPTGAQGTVVYTAGELEQHGRDVVLWTALSKLGTKAPEPITMPLPEGYTPQRDLYAPYKNVGHRWAMVVDLQRCIGCAACTVACYAENNVPIFGPKAAFQGRIMAWLRVIPYRHARNELRTGWLPLLCQHCDDAPCEPVCPVFAAVHNEEGLNAQIYNRCVGTRYCANNCPYKVRRFNWFNANWPEPLHLQLNPEVTVRCRGVMEKCTFCVQRIRAAEYRAKSEGRNVRDGEIIPACVQTCPTSVFTFGDLMDENSAVSRILSQDPRRYQLLHELNTKPANFFLKRILNDESV